VKPGSVLIWILIFFALLGVSHIFGRGVPIIHRLGIGTRPVEAKTRFVRRISLVQEVVVENLAVHHEEPLAGSDLGSVGTGGQNVPHVAGTARVRRIAWEQHSRVHAIPHLVLRLGRRTASYDLPLNSDCDDLCRTFATVGRLESKALIPIHLSPNNYPGSFYVNHRTRSHKGRLGGDFRLVNGLVSFYRLPADHPASNEAQKNQPPFGPFGGCVPMERLLIRLVGCILSIGIMICGECRYSFRIYVLGCVIFAVSSLVWLTGHLPCDKADGEYRQTFPHDGEKVAQNYARPCFFSTRRGGVLIGRTHSALHAFLPTVGDVAQKKRRG
jgi:hypothetical protein